jgi:hypothetical protein
MAKKGGLQKTSNIQHSTPNAGRGPDLGRSALNVECAI